MGATSDAPAARRIVRGWAAYLTVMAAASLPACEMDPLANPAPELERGPVTLRSLSASIGPGVPVVLSAGAEIADSGSCPYAEDATLPITVLTTGGDTRVLHLAPRICSGGRMPDGDAVTGWYECARVQLIIPLDSSFAHPDVTAWAAAWLASLEQEAPLEGLGWRMARYHTRRDLHAAVAAAEAIPFAVSASLSRLALVPGSPPPVTVGDFIRVDIWSLTGVVVPASAGDSVRVYYRQPDGTVWTCGFVTPGRCVVTAP